MNANIIVLNVILLPLTVHHAKVLKDQQLLQLVNVMMDILITVQILIVFNVHKIVQHAHHQVLV